MKLYHFTHPGTYWHIAVGGIRPALNEKNEHMTGGVPVVWLTTEESNVCTAADIEHVNALCKGGADREVGDLIYGGSLRLTVRLNTTRRLVRYAVFLDRSCTPEWLRIMRRQLSKKALATWWLYLGTIPPRKIDPISASDYIECLNHHVETHPDLSVRETYAAQRERLMTVPPDAPIRLNIAS
jgi:hypothetical protein